MSCYTCGEKATQICSDCGAYSLCESTECGSETAKIHYAICHDMSDRDPKYVCSQLEEAVLDMQLHDVDDRYDETDINDAIELLADLDEHHTLNEHELKEVVADAHSIIADHLYDFASQEAFSTFDREDQNAIIGAGMNGDYQLYHMSNMAFDRIDARENEEARRERLAARDRLRSERARKRAMWAREYGTRAMKRGARRAAAKRRRAKKKRERAIERREALRKRAERARNRATRLDRRGDSTRDRLNRQADRTEKSAVRSENYAAFKNNFARNYADRSDKRADRYDKRDQQKRANLNAGMFMGYDDEEENDFSSSD